MSFESTCFTNSSNVIGLCPDCSTKLNYRSKKREVKKLKKLSKMKPNKKRSQPSDSDNDLLSTDKMKETDRSGETSGENDLNTLDDSKNDVPDTNLPSESKPAEAAEGSWTKPSSNNAEEKSREEEFDEYLEDLLL